MLDIESNICSYGSMRWQGQELGVADAAALPGLENLNGLVRSVTTPEFAGVTLYLQGAGSCSTVTCVLLTSSTPRRCTGSALALTR